MSQCLEITCGHVTSFGQWKMSKGLICQFRVEAFKYSFSTFQPTFPHHSNCQCMCWLGSVTDWIKLECWANTWRTDALVHCLDRCTGALPGHAIYFAWVKKTFVAFCAKFGDYLLLQYKLNFPDSMYKFSSWVESDFPLYTSLYTTFLYFNINILIVIY